MKRYFWFVLGAIGIALGVVFFAKPQDIGERRTVVVVGSPVTVWSWDTSDNSFTVLSLSSQYITDAPHGYGPYSLEALWKLGFIEKKGGTLLIESLSDVFGIPISWYISTQKEEARQIFSLTNIPAMLGKQYQTNMPIRDFITFSRALSASRSDKMNRINIDRMGVAIDEKLPDGSIRHVLSPDLIDHELTGVFEQALVRKEGLSVAVYNTTDVPFLGTKASRLLTNAGILVVTVGNDKPMISHCEVRGKEQSLSSKTVKYVVGVFGCKKIQSEEENRADIILRIGTNFARRFVAN